MPLGFVTGGLDPIKWEMFNIFSSWVRILVCFLNQFLTKCIKEFRNSLPCSNCHILCGICEWLDGGIGATVLLI